jgi:hypothetical protein
MKIFFNARIFFTAYQSLSNNSRITERILREMLMSSLTGISERVKFLIKIGHE